MSAIEIRELTPDEWTAIADGPLKTAFPDVLDYRFREHQAPEVQAAEKKLHARLGTDHYRLRLGAFVGDKLAGWSIGLQEDEEAFYMVNAVVLPEYRRRGIYSLMVGHVLRRVTEAGFQRVFSKHVATNNAVIIPKLQAGFVITGLELSDRYGTLVVLTWLADPARRAVLAMRSGERRPDEETRKRLRL